MKHFLPASILAFLFSQSLSAQVVINEYSCSNRTIVADQNGNFEDYIELYNTSGATVDLSGWYLTDTYNNLTKWMFPAGITINANGFLKVWASNKDEVVGTNIHTNFKLTQTSYEEIALVNPTVQIVDSVSLVLTQKDNSRVRRVDGGPVWGVTPNPTPGASNNTAPNYAGYATMPSMSVPQGFYAGTQSVSISSPDPNVTIRYTTNGATPTVTSTIYSSALSVTATEVIRARAFSSDPDILPSFGNTNTYFINVTNVNAGHTFYVLSLASTDFNALFNSWGTWSIDAYLEFFDKNNQFVTEGEGKVDPHGNDSWAFPQKGIDFEMEDDYGYSHGIDYPIFHQTPRPSFDHIILKAAASDNYPFSWGNSPAHLRDAYIQSYSEKNNWEIDERSYEPCEIYINGQYWGVYEIREKTDEPDYTSYYYSQEEPDIDVLKFWGGLMIPYGSDTAWNNLYNYVVNNNMTIPANYAYVGDRLNIKSTIDYDIVNTYVVDCDWINWNTAWWRGRDPDGPLRTKWTYSFWDEDNIFDLGQNYSGWPTTAANADPCDIQQVFSNAGPSMGHMDILTHLMTNTDFKNAYINRYADLMNTTLSCDSMTSWLNHFQTLLTPEMPNQIARWGGNMTQWQNNVAFVQNFINGRCAYIDSALVNCFTLTGPYNITVLVDPPGAGDVQVSTIQPPYYPWDGTYFGNVDLDFHAIPGTNMVLNYWEANNNTILPNINSADMTINLQASDTIIAHFENFLPAYGLTVDVTPAGSGNVNIEGIVPGAYPYLATYISGTSIDLQGLPNSGYQFDYWDLTNQYVNPSSTSANANFTLSTSDYLTAHFKASTGIEDANLSGLNVFPSLTNDEFHVVYQLNSSTDLQMKLYSINGNLVRDFTADDQSLKEAGKHSLDVSMSDYALSPGVYFLKFDYPGFATTFKIVLLPH